MEVVHEICRNWRQNPSITRWLCLSWERNIVDPLVDTEGFLLAVVVHAASIPDRKGGQQVLKAAGDTLPRLQHIWADQGSTGAWVRWAAQEHGWTVQVVYPRFRQMKRYAPELLDDAGYEPGFRVIPRPWVVGRTFSWLVRQRRLSNEYVRLASTEEVFMYLVGIRLLLARLAPA
jgi:putative transposase